MKLLPPLHPSSVHPRYPCHPRLRIPGGEMNVVRESTLPMLRILLLLLQFQACEMEV